MSLFMVMYKNVHTIGLIRTVLKESSSCVRCCSSLASSEKKPLHSDTPMSENDVVNPEFINRNPRNLEFMGLATKRKGWKFQYPPVEFYHRLVYKQSTRSITAEVESGEGDTVVSASTKEFSIAKHLYSLTDVCASKNIGQVLAQRCLQSGLTNMTLLPPDVGSQSQKFQAFLTAIEEGGIKLSEPEEYIPPYSPGIDYDNEEELMNLQERQQKVADVSEEHRKVKEVRKRWNRPNSKWSLPLRPFAIDNKNHRVHPHNDDS